MREANFEGSDTRDVDFMAVGMSVKFLGFVWVNIAGAQGLWSREFFSGFLKPPTPSFTLGMERLKPNNCKTYFSSLLNLLKIGCDLIL